MVLLSKILLSSSRVPTATVRHPRFKFAHLNKLGLNTSANEVKENRGWVVGVTGTGGLSLGKQPHEGRRPYHSSAVLFPDQTTQGKGKGNAGEEATPSSHGVSKDSDEPSGISQQRRSFSTSLSRFDAKDGTHTADSYFKDVDRAPPPSDKTYQVDGTNPTVQRPNEAMSGEYSHAGPQTKEYATVEDNGTYDVPPSTGPEKDQKSRYGNTR